MTFYLDLCSCKSFVLGLCEENLKPSSDGPATLSGDLQGFWDMMMLQVDNIDDSFSEIKKCRENGWKVSRSPSQFIETKCSSVFILETRGTIAAGPERKSYHQATADAISNCEGQVHRSNQETVDSHRQLGSSSEARGATQEAS